MFTHDILYYKKGTVEREKENGRNGGGRGLMKGTNDAISVLHGRETQEYRASNQEKRVVDERRLQVSHRCITDLHRQCEYLAWSCEHACSTRIFSLSLSRPPNPSIETCESTEEPVANLLDPPSITSISTVNTLLTQV